MEIAVLKCKTVTPMFSRGLVPEDRSYPFELRPQSIKGVIRFWFRALAPFLIETDDTSKLKELEGEIFGSTERKAPFALSVEIKRSNFGKASDLIKEKPFNYCLYGVADQGGSIPYTYLDANSDFNITLRFRKDVPKSLMKLIFSLFEIISYYSGFGAKTRKGFGCFSIENIDELLADNNLPSIEDLFDNKTKSISLRELKSKINKNTEKNNSSTNDSPLNNAIKNLKDFIEEIDPKAERFQIKLRKRERDLIPQDFPNLVYSQEAIIVEGETSWKDVVMKIFRPRGPDGRARGFYTELKLNKLRGFRSNDDILNIFRNTIMKGEKLPESTIIKPSILGLPIQYQRVNINPKKTGDKTILINNGEEGDHQRKASPLFLSIHRSSDNTYFARALLMSSKISQNRDPFGNAELIVKYNGKSYKARGYENFNELWENIERKNRGGY